MTVTDPVQNVTDDRAFPALHVRPVAGWVNDPNGPFYWNGRYHLFYQHNPAAPVHADIAWGHASSIDLVHWNTESIALTPTPATLDAGGCWSGCVVNDDGVPTAVYTAIGDGVMDASIALASAGDEGLNVWHKHPVPAAQAPDGLDLLGYRDPFVFTVDGRRYAVVGAGGAGGGAAMVLLYACDDLHRWTYLGPLLSTQDPVAAAHAPADIWECPQLIRLGNRWVLIVSLWTDEVLGRVTYLVGDLDTTTGTPRFTPTHGGLVDAGRDFYAPAVLVTPQRTLLWGWTWEDRPTAAVLKAGWAGALTLPRVLTLGPTGHLHSTPAPELRTLRRTAARHTLTAEISTEAHALPPGPLDIEVILRCPPGRAAALDLSLDDNRLTVTVDPTTGHVELHRQVLHPERVDRAAIGRIEPTTDPLELRLLLDGSVMELFVPDGVVFTERLYPATTSGNPTLRLHAPEGTEAAITAWSLHTTGAP